VSPIRPPNSHAATVAPLLCVAARLLCISFVAACTNTAPHADPPSGSVTASPSSSSGPIALDASVSLDDSGSALLDAATDADIVDDGGSNATSTPTKRSFVPDNKVLPPRESAELTLRAKKLLDAIVHDDPSLGESFWFPKEPFIPLKDVKGPDKYWDNLHASYARDIHALHRKRKSWEGATFVGFKMGSPPKWVAPGDEANKIGYYRSFRGKLTYRVEEKNATIEVHTIISWQGEWFITHLSKFKKK